MKKIAFITPGWSPVPATKGGAVENLIEWLLDENEKMPFFECTVFSIYEKEASMLSNKYEYTKFVFVKYPKIVTLLDCLIYWIAKNILHKKNLISYRNIILRLYVLFRFANIIKPKDFNHIILVTNSTLFLLLKWSHSLRKSASKVIYYLHNEVRSVFHCQKEIESIAGVISISEFVERSFINQFPFLKIKNNNILKNSIDTDAFTNIDMGKVLYYKRKFNFADNDFIVVFTGRIVEEKGALEVLQAIKKLYNIIPIKLLIVGGGFYSSNIIDPYMKKIHAEMAELQNSVVITGYIDYADMPCVYKLGNVAVLPSIWEEPAGLTMVEAAVSGLPLITTNSGGIPEYIPQNCAIFVDRDENLVENLADKIKLLYFNPSMAKQLSEQGVQLKEKYNLLNYFQSFVRIIESYT
ncbi:glycosyltransferase family 4 protein [Bacteroides ovatus]|uniref:glycosyltransferase family 4 protein n=1 Tax=Bacteroides ovatus TaxID=28116 RepID=UPI0020A70E17|nr:glycosyltransferase family 4 protein [Bacteroides ovatus]CAG9903006.1 Lipopolysaccharide 1,2-N-acetylglucosaminetransferase [Bacteroides ovatus]